MKDGFATHLRPPCHAVISTSRHTLGEKSDGEAMDTTVALAGQQPGVLGLDSTRVAERLGITAACCDSLWYEYDEMPVARVERDYARTPAVLS